MHDGMHATSPARSIASPSARKKRSRVLLAAVLGDEESERRGSEAWEGEEGLMFGVKWDAGVVHRDGACTASTTTAHGGQGVRDRRRAARGCDWVFGRWIRAWRRVVVVV
jgi:hypothetical protein